MGFFNVSVVGTIYPGTTADVVNHEVHSYGTYYNDHGGISCFGPQCGGGGGEEGGCDNSCPGSWECGSNGCGNACTNKCGSKFKASPECTSHVCMYNPASLDGVAVSKPCIAENNRSFTIQGNSHYCGDITIRVAYSTGQSDTWTDASHTQEDYTFRHAFTIPDTVDVSPEPGVTITIDGNRNTIKETLDQDTYNCHVERDMDLTYLNFFYCPVYPESSVDGNIYDYYGQQSDYVLNPGLPYYAEWDMDSSCLSDDSITQCSPNPTDCVKRNGQYNKTNSGVYADGADNEYEVCMSFDGKQGGWADADINAATCDKINNVDLRLSKWFDCDIDHNNECTLGQDGFPDDDIGLCCGDDIGEIPLETKTRFGITYMTNVDGTQMENSACCSDSYACADENLICRPAGYNYCLKQGGLTATCTNFEWNVVAQTTCKSGCERCDINTNGAVDEYDYAAIQSCILAEKATEGSCVNPDQYNANQDPVLDQADLDFCAEYLGEDCSRCGDGELGSDEACDIVSENPQFNCQETYCSSDAGSHVQYVRKDECTDVICGCSYDATCNKLDCGGCNQDSDCPGGECNKLTCSCEVTNCAPGTGKCADGTCSPECTGLGCVGAPNGVCGADEGCGCSDCTGQNRGCTQGAVCSVDGLCGCPAGTALCVDNTCSANCAVTDTANQGCITENMICELGEGCACKDCSNKQDSCVSGLECNYLTELCGNACVQTETTEFTIDGKDNDCDGLVDEPYFDYNGIYIWEANCNYYVCAYSQDGTEHIAKGKVTGGIQKAKTIGFEPTDVMTSTGTQLTFESRTNNDVDCMIYSSSAMLTYDLEYSGSKSMNNIYLTERKITPLKNPFQWSSPKCALSCAASTACGESLWGMKINCDYEECLFDCSDYLVDTASTYDIMSMIFTNAGDTCVDCPANMDCSKYNNEASCHFDTCYGSKTNFLCSWNTTAKKCEEIFSPCMPGTTLCRDGTCSQDCSKTDTANMGCVGPADGVCKVGEGCACIDCTDKQGSCTNGAACDSAQICGCTSGTTMCNDKTCDATCATRGGKTECSGIPNGICEFGEGCLCDDCYANKDSCKTGLICDWVSRVCLMPRNAPSCQPGTTLCLDATCDDTCEDHMVKAGCIGPPNGVCQAWEGCACVDCAGKQDSCVDGAICDFGVQLCAASDGGESLWDCVDSDDDGYYLKSDSCHYGTDCNDNNDNISPAMQEICGNDVDENCDGTVETDCSASQRVTIDMTSMQAVDIFGVFDLSITVENKMTSTSEAMTIDVQLPSGMKADRNSFQVGSLQSGEKQELETAVYVKNAKKTSDAMTIDVKGRIAMTKEITFNVNIPAIKIAPDPEDDGSCLNLKYVINKPGLTAADIELNIIDPEMLFSPLLIVDYLRDVDVSGITTGDFVSNPYCLPKRKGIEIYGYLYEPLATKLVSVGGTSKLSLDKEPRKKVEIKVRLG